MNILFVNYGDLTTNSLNHISGFADGLTALGHDCVVAVTDLSSGPTGSPPVGWKIVRQAEVLTRSAAIFPNGRPADILHAWTPREGVRRFVLAHQRLCPATRLVIHLEDNEEHLLEVFGGKRISELRDLPQQAFPFPMVDGLSHPVRYRQFLRMADGLTVIVDRLREFVPAASPCHLLEPGVDFNFFQPLSPDPVWRTRLGLRPEEKTIVFTGSVTFANLGEVSELYTAVRQLNADGIPTRLIRTGFTHPDFVTRLGYDPADFTVDLGFLPKHDLPHVLALADVLVQPGHPGPFNDYRLPSKLPEFLAVGRPVILPATNIGRDLTDGREALLLHEGTPDEIAALCRRVFQDTELARTLANNARNWASSRFDLESNSAKLSAYYRSILVRNSPVDWRQLSRLQETELPLALDALLPQLERAVPADACTAVADAARAVRQLDADLVERATTIAHLRRHAEGLEHTRSALEADIVAIRTAAARHAHQLETELQRAREVVAIAEREAARLQDELRESQHRVIRLQASFSWRATAWLRALRRWLIDPVAGPPRQPPPPPLPARIIRLSPADFTLLPPAPVFHCHLDSPRCWPDRATGLSVRGWVHSREAGPLLGVRARVGERTFEGEYGLARPDVGLNFREVPGADKSGFRITLDLSASDVKVELEALAADSTWHVFYSQTLGKEGASQRHGSYAHWVRQHDTVSESSLLAWRARAAALGSAPLVSILMPVYNPPERWLVEAIRSVRAQVYPHWELCIADDASTQPHVRAVLDRFAREDERIRVVHRPENGRISTASNTALELATGEYSALLDHDDALEPHALLCLVEEALRHPGAVLIYSDEDKIDENGQRFDPHFKPDWNPDLLTSQNYLCHLTMVRTATLRAAGGFRVGFEGAQDWDLFLRVTSTAPAGAIRHVPRVLYHWRAIEGSTALQLGEKDYAVQSARRALEEHFTRQRQPVVLHPLRGGHWRVQRPRPDPAPLVTLVIPTRNRRELLVTCIESIRARTDYSNYEILIADNDSDDPELFAFYERMKTRGRFEVLSCPGPFNYSAINNRAVAHARGQIVGLLNNDLETLHPEWLDEMVAHAVRPGIGCVGAKLYYPDRRIQHAGVITGLGGVAGHAFKGFTQDEPGTPQFRPHLVQNLSAVTAACLLVRREVYLRAGGLDETGLAVAFNDVDFCLKVEALGLRNLFTPFAELLHHESASRGAEDSPEKVQRFQREIDVIRQRWGERLLRDPAYNPNLTLDAEDFGLAYPPRLDGI